jgi:hypothetical protein
MLRPAPIEFGPFFVGELKRPFTFRIAEAFPEGACQFSPIAGPPVSLEPGDFSARPVMNGEHVNLLST